MNNGHSTSVASLGINTQLSAGSVSSQGGSPLNSPLMSQPNSPFHNIEHNWELPSQFTQQMSLQPPPPVSPNANTKPGSGNTFVHKLYNMVADEQYQHLIAWTYSGSSFIVAGIAEFSRDVLPKHFKHNNFSSFVRQLNMYGFHKVNKSPRGHRTLAENQIWEFSHNKFLKNRPDLLDEIKRKALETESSRRDTNDMSSHMTMMQMSQTDMLQQIGQITDNLNHVVHELQETKKRQNAQQQMIKDMLNFMSKQYGAQIPFMFDSEINHSSSIMDETASRPPPIFITDTATPNNQQRLYLNVNTTGSASSATSESVPNSPLSQTPTSPSYLQNRSPSLTPSYQNAINTPLPPSPCNNAPSSNNNFLQEDDHFNNRFNSSNNNDSGNHMLDQQQFYHP